MNKKFINANQLLDDAFILAEQIFSSGFKPDFIVGVWRGGTPIGIAIHEFFEVLGIDSDHIAIRASSYSDIDNQKDEIEILGMEYLLGALSKEHKVLFVDDVFDSGRTIQAIIALLKNEMADACPEDIRVACPYFKPERNQTALKPDYFLHVTKDWLVFPHELKGLTKEELKRGKGEKISELLDRIHINAME